MDYDTILFEQRQQEAQNQRLAQYRTNWKYYNGEHDKPLKVRQGQPDDNVIVNLARLIIDKGASFLFGKEIEFQLQEGDKTPEEERLDAIWQRNRKMTRLAKMAVSGGVYGHVFEKIMLDDWRGNCEHGTPRLISIEPENMTVFWDPGDIEMAYKYVIQWLAVGRNGKGEHRRETTALNDAGKWEIVNEVRETGAGGWNIDEAHPPIVWPYDWPPIIDCQNIPVPGAYYGLSDLEDLSEQDAINYVASKVQRILRYHAHPKSVASGMGTGDIKINEDDVLILPSAESKLWNLEMQSDLSAAQAFLDRLISLMMRQARVPNLDPAEVSVGAMSGFALKVIYGDLLEKTELKRRTYGDMIIELNRRLLEMSGFGPDNVCTIHWPDPLPEDHAAQKERDTFELDYGLASKETVRTRRGLDTEGEQERIDAEKDADDVREGNVGAMLVRNFGQGRDNTTPETRIER